MVQLYCGDGKGKTTAATGAAVRAAGSNIPVLFVQFLKDDSSGEISSLKKLPLITVLHSECFYGFVSGMSEEEKEDTRRAYSGMLDRVDAYLQANQSCVVILDEVIHAVNYKLVDICRLRDILKKSNETVEIVLTGRNPSEDIVELADYYTEFKKLKHVYDRGIMARKGIEY